jgi:hypothetical protein
MRKRSRTKAHHLFQARISPTAETLRRELQRQSGLSNGQLIERALCKLKQDGVEQQPEAAA